MDSIELKNEIHLHVIEFNWMKQNSSFLNGIQSHEIESNGKWHTLISFNGIEWRVNNSFY